MNAEYFAKAQAATQDRIDHARRGRHTTVEHCPVSGAEIYIGETGYRTLVTGFDFDSIYQNEEGDAPPSAFDVKLSSALELLGPLLAWLADGALRSAETARIKVCALVWGLRPQLFPQCSSEQDIANKVGCTKQAIGGRLSDLYAMSRGHFVTNKNGSPRKRAARSEIVRAHHAAAGHVLRGQRGRKLSKAVQAELARIDASKAAEKPT